MRYHVSVASLKAPANDSVARVVAFLGDRWTFLILRESFFGVRRFGEFARRLEISRTLLSERLRRLVDQGVLERRRYQADPEFFEYVLTEAGLALYPAVVSLMHWGDTYL